MVTCTGRLEKGGSTPHLDSVMLLVPPSLQPSRDLQTKDTDVKPGLSINHWPVGKPAWNFGQI